MKTPRSRAKAGFTLLEMLVVLAIIALLAAIMAPQVLSYLGSSRTEVARTQIQNLSAALDLFRLGVGRYPTGQEGLNALVTAPPNVQGWNGPYMKKEKALIDPWGRPYLYKAPGQHGEFDISSLGSDGVEGGTKEAQDVGSWQ